MRITDQEKQAFIDVISQYIEGAAELRLHGSRANDTKKGGDIDLLLLTDTDETAEQLMYRKARMLSEIKALIGEQKIDLLITTPNDPDAFVQHIIPTSLLLHKW